MNFTIAATFFLGSALAGVAGVMAGLLFNQVTNTIGFIAGLKAFTAAVVGGIGSIPGAMLGGLLIGIAESFITGYISSTYTNLFVFGAADRRHAGAAHAACSAGPAAEGVRPP